MKPPPPPPKTSSYGSRQILAKPPEQRLGVGIFGLQATGRVQLSPRRTLSIKRALGQQTRKQGSLWLRYAAGSSSRNGQILFELEGVSESTALAAFQAIKSKLPMALHFTRRQLF